MMMSVTGHRARSQKREDLRGPVVMHQYCRAYQRMRMRPEPRLPLQQPLQPASLVLHSCPVLEAAQTPVASAAALAVPWAMAQQALMVVMMKSLPPVALLLAPKKTQV